MWHNWTAQQEANSLHLHGPHRRRRAAHPRKRSTDLTALLASKARSEPASGGDNDRSGNRSASGDCNGERDPEGGSPKAHRSNRQGRRAASRIGPLRQHPGSPGGCPFEHLAVAGMAVARAPTCQPAGFQFGEIFQRDLARADALPEMDAIAGDRLLGVLAASRCETDYPTSCGGRSARCCPRPARYSNSSRSFGSCLRLMTALIDSLLSSGRLA